MTDMTFILNNSLPRSLIKTHHLNTNFVTYASVYSEPVLICTGDTTKQKANSTLQLYYFSRSLVC